MNRKDDNRDALIGLAVLVLIIGCVLLAVMAANDMTRHQIP